MFTKTKVLILSLLFFSGELDARIPSAKVGVSPSRFELVYDKRAKTQVITLINYSDKPITAEISLSNWTLKDGKIVEIAPTPQSLDQWILITPMRFTIKPKDMQKIRFAIRSRVKPKPGEHRAIIWFNEIPHEKSSKGIQFKFKLGVPVYLSVPPAKPKGVLKKLTTKVGKGEIFVTLAHGNTGNVHDRLTGSISLWKTSPKLSRIQRDKILQGNGKHKALVHKTTLPAIAILPKLTPKETIRIPKPKRKGTYLLYLKGHYKDGKEIIKEMPVYIK